MTEEHKPETTNQADHSQHYCGATLELLCVTLISLMVFSLAVGGGGGGSRWVAAFCQGYILNQKFIIQRENNSRIQRIMIKLEQ